jgi:hypothetical protein
MTSTALCIGRMWLGEITTEPHSTELLHAVCVDMLEKRDAFIAPEQLQLGCLSRSLSDSGQVLVTTAPQWPD